MHCVLKRKIYIYKEKQLGRNGQIHRKVQLSKTEPGSNIKS